MEREIKFRAWDRGAHRMYHEVLTDGRSIIPKWQLTTTQNEDCFIDPEIYSFNAKYNDSVVFELMQYINVKDKYQKEIYEADILKITWSTAAKGKYFQTDDMWVDHEEIVRVGYSVFGFTFHKKEGGKQFQIGRGMTIEIIGNIHENPLLFTPSLGDETNKY